MFTIEQLQERITNIKNEMEQTKANYAKLEGHLGESVHWLGEAVKKLEEEKKIADEAALKQEESKESVDGDQGQEVHPESN